MVLFCRDGCPPPPRPRKTDESDSSSRSEPDPSGAAANGGDSATGHKPVTSRLDCGSRLVVDPEISES